MVWRAFSSHKLKFFSTLSSAQLLPPFSKQGFLQHCAWLSTQQFSDKSQDVPFAPI